MVDAAKRRPRCTWNRGAVSCRRSVFGANNNTSVSAGGVGVVAAFIGIGIGRAIDAIGGVSPPVAAVAIACRPAIAVAGRAAQKITLKTATNAL